VADLETILQERDACGVRAAAVGGLWQADERLGVCSLRMRRPARGADCCGAACCLIVHRWASSPTSRPSRATPLSSR
jgi:hypothetical protein